MAEDVAVEGYSSVLGFERNHVSGDKRRGRMLFAEEGGSDKIDLKLRLFSERVEGTEILAVEVGEQPAKEWVFGEAIAFAALLLDNVGFQDDREALCLLTDADVAEIIVAVRDRNTQYTVTAHRHSGLTAEIARGIAHNLVAERAEQLGKQSVELKAVTAAAAKHDLVKKRRGLK